MSYFCKVMPSPVGALTLIASDLGLTAILWQDDNPNRVRLPDMQENPTHPVLVETERQLNEYFAGTRTTFTMTLDFVGTEFQKKSGRRWWPFRLGKRAAMPISPARLATRRRSERSARPTVKINLDYCSLSSRDWIEWQTDRICRRSGGQSLPAED